LICPVCALAAVGLKVTVTVHVALGPNEVVQVFVWANIVLVLAILSPAIAVAPPFFTVNVVAVELPPAVTEPNANEVGAMVTAVTAL
jgi:hypothetical protein